MRNASGYQGENERQRKKKVNNRTTYDISSIKRVTRKFLEVSRCRRAKQRQRNVQKNSVLHLCCTCKVVSLLIRPSVFWLFSLPSLLSITRVYILFQ